MTKQTKWVPKEETIGVPGEGYIRKDAFNNTHLKALKARAANRKLDEHTFLLSAGLVPVTGQFDLELEKDEDGLGVDGNGQVIEKKESVSEELTEDKPKKGKKKEKKSE